MLNAAKHPHRTGFLALARNDKKEVCGTTKKVPSTSVFCNVMTKDECRTVQQNQRIHCQHYLSIDRRACIKIDGAQGLPIFHKVSDTCVDRVNRQQKHSNTDRRRMQLLFGFICNCLTK